MGQVGDLELLGREHLIQRIVADDLSHHPHGDVPDRGLTVLDLEQPGVNVVDLVDERPTYVGQHEVPREHERLVGVVILAGVLCDRVLAPKPELEPVLSIHGDAEYLVDERDLCMEARTERLGEWFAEAQHHRLLFRFELKEDRGADNRRDDEAGED